LPEHFKSQLQICQRSAVAVNFTSDQEQIYSSSLQQSVSSFKQTTTSSEQCRGRDFGMIM